MVMNAISKKKKNCDFFSKASESVMEASMGLSLFKVNNKETRPIPTDFVLMSLLLTLSSDSVIAVAYLGPLYLNLREKDVLVFTNSSQKRSIIDCWQGPKPRSGVCLPYKKIV